MAVRNNDVDGANIAFTNPSDIFTSTPFSAMAWCKLYSGGSNPTNRAIILVWDNPSDKSWAIRTDTTGSLVLRCTVSFDGSANNTLVGSTVLSLDTWFHAGMDFDGTDQHLWLNGVLEATLNDPGTVFNSGEGFGIGGTGDGGNQMDDDIADARYYDRILSAEEWLTIFTARGHDGIVDGLSARPILDDFPPGTSLVPSNASDQGPNQIPYFRSYGAPRPTYVEGPGLSSRKRV